MFGDIRDDPTIRQMERTGYPHWMSDDRPKCPCCGQECETIYKADGEIVGCDSCLLTYDAWEEDACFPNRGRDEY